MSYSSLSKIAVICSLIILLSVFFVNAYPLLAHEPYIAVKLKDKTIHKFEYDSFELNWISPHVIDQFSCEANEIDVGNLREIHVMSMNEYFCGDEEMEDRLFDVYSKNYSRGIVGFIQLKEPNVTGKLFDSGEIRNILYEKIDKIIFSGSR